MMGKYISNYKSDTLAQWLFTGGLFPQSKC